MGARSHNASRCPWCRMHVGRCICALIPTLAVRTRITLVMHQREWHKTTNTGHLALRALSGSRLFLWGEEHQAHGSPPGLRSAAPPDDVVAPGTTGYLLAPSGLPLTPERAAALVATPLTLVVTDGSWRQATKMLRRVPALAPLPRLALPPGAPSAYHLRDEPHPEGLATIEAIARALGILEGPAVEAALLRPFLAMVAGTLASRGEHSAPTASNSK